MVPARHLTWGTRSVHHSPPQSAGKNGLESPEKSLNLEEGLWSLIGRFCGVGGVGRSPPPLPSPPPWLHALLARAVADLHCGPSLLLKATLHVSFARLSMIPGGVGGREGHLEVLMEAGETTINGNQPSESPQRSCLREPPPSV